MRVVFALALCWLCACSAPAAAVETPIPARAVTATEGLLAHIPAGADLILEVDLARLRENPVVGGLLAELSPPAALAPQGDLLSTATQIIVAVYDVGDAARQLIVVKGLGQLAGARLLGEGIVAVGDDALLAHAEALVDASGSVAVDDELMRLRAEAMPEAAKSATLRVSARLDFDGRVALAAQLGMSEVPEAGALWGDVVDDLALVAELRSADDKDAERLEAALRGLQGRILREPFVRFIGLAPAIARARIERRGQVTRATVVVSPKRLALCVKRLQGYLTRSAPAVSEPPDSESP